MKNRKNSVGYTLVEVAIIVVIIGLLLSMAIPACFMVKDKEPKERATYAAWVKQTGNPKHITFEEWRLLAEMNQSREVQPVIILNQ